MRRAQRIRYVPLARRSCRGRRRLGADSRVAWRHCRRRRRRGALRPAQARRGRKEEIAGGYELSTRREFAPWILKIELQRKARQATQSALETLAILAYKQPLTRAEIEALRGVDTSGVLNTLMEKNFIKITGKKEVPGRPFMYGTTEKFLEHFGLKELRDLPSIDEIRQMVDSSVKKEELIGTKKIVDVPQSDAPQDGTTPASGIPEDASQSTGDTTPHESEGKI